MKKALLTFVVILSSLLVLSQQDPHYSQYMFNQVTFNPASAGSQDEINIGLINRQQWAGFKDAPTTIAFHVNSPVRLFGRVHGIGIHIFNDKYAFNSDIAANIVYAYKIQIGTGRLSIGANVGARQNALKGEWKTSGTGSIVSGTGSDPSIPTASESDKPIKFDMGLGIYYKTDDFYVGFSSSHILSPLAPNYTYDGASYTFSRHYYLVGGYNFKLPNPLFEAMPTLYISSSELKAPEINMGALLTYNKKISAGFYWRKEDALIGMLNIELFNGVRIGYAYDFITSNIANYSGGGHELMVSYGFKINTDKTPQKYKSVRFL